MVANHAPGRPGYSRRARRRRAALGSAVATDACATAPVGLLSLSRGRAWRCRRGLAARAAVPVMSVHGTRAPRYRRPGARSYSRRAPCCARGILSAAALELQQAVVVPHHPVVAHRACGLEAEHLVRSRPPGTSVWKSSGAAGGCANRALCPARYSEARNVFAAA